MFFILIGVGVIIGAIIWAKLEIQIEGKDGWAKNLPTWRKINRVTKIFLGGRPLTGYHFWMWVFLFYAVHFLVCIFTSFFTQWSLGKQLLLIGYLIIFAILEDFFWFVFNPAFGLKKFRGDNLDIWWYRKWWLGIPSVYWLSIVAMVILFYFGLFALGP